MTDQQEQTEEKITQEKTVETILHEQRERYLKLTDEKPVETAHPQVVQYIGKDVKLGENVRKWHFTYIGDGSEIGDNTKIGSLVHIDYNVKIGSDCKVEGMAYIPPLTKIGDRVFIGPGVIFTNDPYPMSDKMIGVTVEDDAVICAGSVLRPGITIGTRSVIGMGAIVTKDVPPDSVVYGNPANVKYTRDIYLRKKAEWERE